MRVVLRGEPRLPDSCADPRIDAALLFAACAHGSQRYGDRPYSSHLARVMATAAGLGFTSPEHLITAALHDVLEDTDVTHTQLRERFGSEIADAVAELTRNKALPIEHDYASMGPLAFAVKLADRLSNLERHGRATGAELEKQREKLFPKYDREQAKLRAHPLAKDPRFKAAIARVEAELSAARLRLHGAPPERGARLLGVC
jgi:hypothetical protein